GGDGNDLILGGKGTDVALMGAGDDTFVWNPGDGSDTIDGQGGHDTMRFNGNDLGENIDISADGEHVRFVRDLASVTMDLSGVEQIDFNAKGGADTITINDLSGTDVTQINLNLAGGGGKSVVVKGTAGDDVVVVSGDSSGISVVGLAAQVN